MCISSIWSWQCYGLYGLVFNALAKNLFKIRIPLGSIFLPHTSTLESSERSFWFTQSSHLIYVFSILPLLSETGCPLLLSKSSGRWLAVVLLLSECLLWFCFTEILLHYLEHNTFTKEMGPAVGLWLCTWLFTKARKSSVQVKMGIWRNWSLFWNF